MTNSVVNLCSEIEQRALLASLLAQKRVGQQVIATDKTTGVESIYNSKNACARALGVHHSYIVEGSLLKQGKYSIRFITRTSPITLSIKATKIDNL